MAQARSIYREDFELLHEGMQRMARVQRWQIIERPTEPDLDASPPPNLVTLESLGLGRLRPPPPEPEPPMACESCVNRNNPPGDGPCVNCDLTIDGPDSAYCAESDEPIKSSDAELDDFAARAAADDGETWGDDNRSNAEVDAAVTQSVVNLDEPENAPAFKERVDPDAFLDDDEGEDEP